MGTDYNGSTSKLEHTTANLLQGSGLFTILVWALPDTQGEATFGRLVVMPHTGGGGAINVGNVNTVGTIQLEFPWTTTNGKWDIPITNAAWNAIAFSYDNSSDVNDPIARVNFASATVTEDTAPVGTAVAPADGYCVGNRSDQARTWDGGIGPLMVHNVILTAEEMDAQLRCPGSIRRGLVLHLNQLNGADRHDLSGNGFHPTATGLANRNGPPMLPWHTMQHYTHLSRMSTLMPQAIL